MRWWSTTKQIKYSMVKQSYLLRTSKRVYVQGIQHRYNSPFMRLKKNNLCNEENPHTTLWSIFIMPQIKASSSERGPLRFFYSPTMTFWKWWKLTWYYSMYGWLSSQKWECEERGGFGKQRQEMQVEIEVRMGSGRASIKVGRKTFIYPCGKRNKWKCTDTLHDKIALQSNKGNAHQFCWIYHIYYFGTD